MASTENSNPQVEILARRLCYAYQLGCLQDKPWPFKERQLEAEGLAVQQWQDWLTEAQALYEQIQGASSSG